MSVQSVVGTWEEEQLVIEGDNVIATVREVRPQIASRHRTYYIS
jgi:hypothetical protein